MNQESETTGLKSLTHMVNAALAIEKLRVASEVRQTHLFLNGLKALEEEGIITVEQVATYKKDWEKNRSTEGIPQELRLHDLETDELIRRQKDLELFVDGIIEHKKTKGAERAITNEKTKRKKRARAEE